MQIGISFSIKKEAILLPGAAEDELVLGRRKFFLINQGFIRSELEIYWSWSKVDTMEFIKKEFEDKLSQIPKKPGKFRYENIFS